MSLTNATKGFCNGFLRGYNSGKIKRLATEVQDASKRDGETASQEVPTRGFFSNWRMTRLLRRIHRDTPPPVQFLKARTIWIENSRCTSEVEGAAFQELKKWGRFEINDRAPADLVLHLSVKPPGVDFNTWYDGDPAWDYLSEMIKHSLGYSLLKVMDGAQSGYVLGTFAEVWLEHPRVTGRNLVGSFRKTVKDAEKWYAQK